MTSEAAPTSYDDVPYIRAAFHHTHPDRLASIARLFGMTPPPVATCRVLELGCASGDNLAPMAEVLPGAQFIGIDLSNKQIEEGQAMVRALDLPNVELRHANILDMDASWGQFDYIVCHGIYSWVPDIVRKKILSICQHNLHPQGVAYVSYNTYPGWRMRGMIRDMMLYHSGQFEGAKPKLEQARALLDFLAQSTSTDTPYGLTLKQEVDAIRGQPDSYIFHDHLEDINEPRYFHQFVAEAAQSEMQFLGEAEFGSMMVSNFPPPVAETLRKIAPDIVRMEQYMDFVRNRTFRQTLLVHADAPLTRAVNAQLVREFHIASAARAVSSKPSIDPGVPEQFRTPTSASLSTSHPITKAAFLVLAECWPQTMPFEQLVLAAAGRVAGNVAAVPDPAQLEAQRQRLATDLFQAYAATLIELRTHPVMLGMTIEGKPQASKVARAQAGRPGAITNLRHETLQLDPFNRQFLMLLDGTRDRDALVEGLAEAVRTGALEVKHNGQPLTDPASVTKVLYEAVNENLPKIARLALLRA